jgi:hypothetical protein
MVNKLWNVSHVCAPSTNLGEGNFCALNYDLLRDVNEVMALYLKFSYLFSLSFFLSGGGCVLSAVHFGGIGGSNNLCVLLIESLGFGAKWIMMNGN